MTDLMPVLSALLFLATPVALLLGALGQPNHARGWSRTLLVAGVALCLSIAGSVGLMWLPQSGFARLGIRLDVLSALMLVMVNFIGLMILRFSHHYMAAEPGQHSYQRWFLATLAAVSLLVITDNLLLLLLSWVACSLTLHRLLVFYPERPKAVLAAHKKFILSRIADLALLVAVGIMIFHFETLSISALLSPELLGDEQAGSSVNVAAMLIALVAILKCAQLPFHGWLLQVMEAPTPVSALLHAGIVNIGGFLIIRFSPLLGEALYANTLLVVVGTMTAVVASLIMMTRISIKVMLAWSTCAQMGFMLLECGLGAYDLALLHLLAHSLYKAYSFLNAGDTVNNMIRTQLAIPPIKPNIALAAVVSLTVFCGFVLALWYSASWQPGNYGYISLFWIISIALCVILIEGLKQPLLWARLSVVPVVLILGLFYALWHQFFSDITAEIAPESTATQWGALFVILTFSLFYLLYVVIRVYPHCRLSQFLYPRLYAGLYLDEWFTRQALRLWPVQLHVLSRRREPVAKQMINTGEH